MGLPLPTTANPASGTPARGDQANAVVSGSFTAAGQVSAPFAFYGSFNVAIWGSINTALTTSAGVAKASVVSATGIAAGEGISSTLLPPGATVKSVESSTTIQIGGLSTAQIAAIATGTDAGAIFTGIGAEPTATIDLERSFDGGTTWLTCGVDATGTPATYQFGSSNLTAPVNIVVSEPELMVAYRLNCRVYSSGTVNYRLSASGLAAKTWGPGAG